MANPETVQPEPIRPSTMVVPRKHYSFISVDKKNAKKIIGLPILQHHITGYRKEDMEVMLEKEFPNRFALCTGDMVLDEFLKGIGVNSLVIPTNTPNAVTIDLTTDDKEEQLDHLAALLRDNGYMVTKVSQES